MSDPIEKKLHLTRINMPSLVEGEVIKKTHITNVFDNEEFENAADLDSIAVAVQPNQIREEGLDPINFSNISEMTAARPKAAVRTNTSVIIPDHHYWTPVEKPSGFDNSDHPSRAKLNIDWDPEKHTHVVIRCSGMLSTDLQQQGGGPGFRNAEELHHNYQVGLTVKGPLSADTLADDAARKTRFNPSGMPFDVWPYQTVRLNRAFSDRYKNSFMPPTIGPYYRTLEYAYDTYGEETDFGFRSDAEEILDSGRGALYAGYPGVQGIPKGSAREHMYDKRSGINQSFNLIAHGSSKLASSGEAISPNSFFFGSEGTISVTFMMRRNVTSFDYSDSSQPRLSNLFLSATVYGR